METCHVRSPRPRIEVTLPVVPASGPAGRPAPDLAVERTGDVSLVRVRTSKLTYPVLSAFLEQVRAILAEGARHLVFDLAAVSYIDSSTIGCFLEIHGLVGDRGGAVRLVRLQRRVHTMLSMTGVDRFLIVLDDEADALASLFA